jgi:ferritin-like metal-binding protein YciE
MENTTWSTTSSWPDNVGPTERWLSAAAGLALLLSATRGGGLLGRLARGGAGLSLMARGATGYCAMKGALQGQTTVGQGLQEQFRRLTSDVGAATQQIERRLEQRAAPTLDSMEALYIAELQELHSAESQLIVLARELMRVLGNAPLAFRIEEYATELQARKAELESLLARSDASQMEHPDDAMRALINETHKMAEITAENVRDAAIAASVQRIIHYKLAGYGTIASYAKALGRLNDAQHFAQLADRDKAIDAEITDIAKDILNPEAVLSPHETPASDLRTH